MYICSHIQLSGIYNTPIPYMDVDQLKVNQSLSDSHMYMECQVNSFPKIQRQASHSGSSGPVRYVGHLHWLASDVGCVRSVSTWQRSWEGGGGGRR